MEKTNQTFAPLARKERLVVEQMADEVLVYDLTAHKAHCLNLTAAVVWQNCNGKNDISQIARIASRDLQANVSEEVVLLALNQLEKFKLLEKKKESHFSIPNISRREVMKRVGIVSAIALPVVASIIVPTAMANASCALVPCGVGGSCNAPCNCDVPGGPGTCI